MNNNENEANKFNNKNDGNNAEKRVRNLKKKRKRKKIKFTVAVICLMLLLLIAGSGIWLWNQTTKMTANGDGPAAKPPASDEATNILMVGLDIGTPGSKDENDPKRTDTMMLIHINPKNDETNIISIPRDTMIYYKGKREKINSANAIGGIDLSIAAVENLLGTKVNYYAKVDYNGFNKFIDALGGVDMKIDNRMDYDDTAQNLHIHFKKGETIHLDGKKAEEFFRWRKNNDGTGIATGDIGRIDNQHIFISEVVKKCKSPTSLAKIPKILSTATDYITTNMTGKDILKYGATLIGGSHNIKTSTLKGDTPTVEGVSYFAYDKKQNSDVLAILQSTGGEDKANSGNDTNTNTNATNTKGNDEKTVETQAKVKSKADLKIEILNASGKSGLASKYADKLKELGYANIDLGNSAKVSASTIWANGDGKTEGNNIKKALSIKNVENSSKEHGEYDIVIVLGNDIATKK